MKNELIVNNSFLVGFVFLFFVCGVTFFLHPQVINFVYHPHDFQFHFFKASGHFVEKNEWVDQEKLDAYPPLSGWLFAPFSFNIIIFYVSVLFVFFVLFGLLLVRLSGHWVSALFWVACSAPWFFLEGIIAQGIMTLLLLGFVFTKNIYLRLFLLVLALLTHGWGFWLLGGYWILEIVLNTNWRGVVLGVCGTSFFPVEAKVGATIQEVQASTTGTNLVGSKGLNMTNYVVVARWLLMFPLLPFGFIGLWKLNKTWFWFCLLGFIGAFVLLYWRIVESLMPFIVLGLTQYYQGLSKKGKFLLILIALGLIVIQLINYLYTIQNVHLSLTTLVFNLPCALGLVK